MFSIGEALSDPVMRFLRKVADKLFGGVNDRDLESKEHQTHLSKPCSNKSTSALTGVSEFTAVACTINQSLTCEGVHSEGKGTSIPAVALAPTDSYLPVISNSQRTYESPESHALQCINFGLIQFYSRLFGDGPLSSAKHRLVCACH